MDRIVDYLTVHFLSIQISPRSNFFKSGRFGGQFHAGKLNSLSGPMSRVGLVDCRIGVTGAGGAGETAKHAWRVRSGAEDGIFYTKHGQDSEGGRGQPRKRSGVV